MIGAREWADAMVTTQWSERECRERSRRVTRQAPWWWSYRGKVPPNPHLDIRRRINYRHYLDVVKARRLADIQWIDEHEEGA